MASPAEVRTFVSIIQDAVEVVMEMLFVRIDSQLPSHSFQGRQGSIGSQLRRSELKVFSLHILREGQKRHYLSL